MTGTGYAPSCAVGLEVSRPDGTVDTSTVTTDADGNSALTMYSAACEANTIVERVGQDDTAKTWAWAVRS